MHGFKSLRNFLNKKVKSLPNNNKLRYLQSTILCCSALGAQFHPPESIRRQIRRGAVKRRNVYSFFIARKCKILNGTEVSSVKLYQFGISLLLVIFG